MDLLNKNEDLFDGTLGDWNTLPVSFELKEGVKPYHNRAYPLPTSHKETLKKELNNTRMAANIWMSVPFIYSTKNPNCEFS